MPGGGTRTFLEPDHYEASLGQVQIQAIILPRDKFRARLTWAELHYLQVCRCQEDAPRIAYLQFAPGLAFVTFSADSGPLPVWRGTEMQADDIVFHGRGERLHQSTPGPSVWNVIAMDPAQLEHYGRALSGTPFSLPAEGRTLQPSRRIAASLRRLHARICRLAETKPKIVSHFEVARAMEQGLIQMLVTCLTTARARAGDHIKRRHARIMVRFEEVLAEHLSRPLRMPELCALVAVSDRTLRSCCAEFLGMSPTQYVLLRRLKEVRRALRDANFNTVSVAEVAHRFGFAELGRFAETYRATFGEAPSATLQRIPGMRPPGSVNFPNFCIVDDEINGLVSPRWASLPAEISQLGKSSARLHKEEKVKQLYLLGISLLAVSACVPQVPQPAAPPLAATGLAAGSQTNTTTAFDGYYGNAVARNVSPGCPDFVTGRDLTIRNGLATFQTGAPATGTGIPATGTLNFQGYVNPQGGLAMVSQTGGQTFQGQIDPNFVLTGRAAGPNCLYDASWQRIRGL